MDIQKFGNPGALRTDVYVPGKSTQEVKRELGLTDVIKLASNEAVHGASKEAIEGYIALTDELHVYPDSVSRDLRAKLSERLGCSADNITVSNGADGVIYNLGMAVIGEGDEAIIPEVTFPMYEKIVKIMRGSIVYSGMDGFRISLDSIEKAITPKTKIIFLCNPSNPTGDAQKKDEMIAFLKRVPKDIMVVIDEAYIDFAEPDRRPGTVELFNQGMDNLFILRSFSKIYGLAGCRVGYGIGHKDLITLIHQIKPPFNVSLVGERVALAALNEKGREEKTLKEMREARNYFYKELDAMGLSYVESHTNFVLIDTGLDAKEVFQNILRKGIIVRPTTGFGLKTCIRVTIGKEEENRAFMKVLKETMQELS